MLLTRNNVLPVLSVRGRRAKANVLEDGSLLALAADSGSPGAQRLMGARESPPKCGAETPNKQFLTRLIERLIDYISYFIFK